MSESKWAIICESLHICVGPFDSWIEAEEDAIRETREQRLGQGCVYRAIPFIELENDNVELPDLGIGQYL